MQKKLTNEAIGKTVAKEKKAVIEKPAVNLDDRIQKFEKLLGLANQREWLTETLIELTKFNYNQDSRNLEFKMTNSNLIKLVTMHLQSTLEYHKSQIEQQIEQQIVQQIVQFEL